MCKAVDMTQPTAMVHATVNERQKSIYYQLFTQFPLQREWN
jgi:hypothetical protein